MKTTFDALDIIYPIVNVAAVRTTISGGKVYRNSRPENSVTKDIVIVSLPITGGHKDDTDIQQCTVMVNAFVKDLEAGRPDDKNLDTITAAVMTVIEAYNSTTSYARLEIINHSVFEDVDQAGISYSSIRINCIIQYEA